MLAWASTWPDWQSAEGAESPHPVIAIGGNAVGEVAVLPVSSKPDLGKARLALTMAAYPSAFTPRGPLSISPSFICIADRTWALTMRWARVGADALVLPRGEIRLRRITVLDPAEWRRLQGELAIAITQARERKP